jgi:hypothetical protein
LDASVAGVSNVEHWLLTRVIDPGNNASCRVRLFWESETVSGILDKADLRVGHFYNPGSGLKWYNFGFTVTDNGNGSGSVLSTTTFTSFSPITFVSEFGFALPIVLTSFSAHAGEDRSVEVMWSTASEINNDYFTVERSRTGSEFEPFMKVTGAGTTHEENSYSVTDTNPYGGVSYYRLRQTDFDGKSSHSKIVSVSMPENDWSIYPNPSNGSTIHVQVPKQYESKPLLITVVDSRGITVLKQLYDVTQQGSIELTGDFPLTSGIYQVIISDGVFRNMKLLVVKR